MNQTAKLLAALTVALLLATSFASAEVPQMLNYQAVLKDSTDRPIRNETRDVQFAIYEDSIDNTTFWIDTVTVTTNNNGAFHTLLGAHKPIPESAFDGSVRWLGIQIEGNFEQTPRTPLVSVGYAYKASRSDTADFALSSGGGGWVDDGATVRLETETDRVGIGTTTPDEKLTVSGNAHITGNLRVEGSITPSPIGWRHSGAQVFSGTAPSVWTDLDLSGYIGANYALVLIKVKGASGSATHVFRPNGDTDEYFRCNDFADMGAQGHKGECAEAGVVVAETDGNGIVEWRGQGTNVTLTLLGYIR